MKEAKTKTEKAISETTAQQEGFEKSVWFAAEAVEYSSLLFSLTYGLEDFNPAVPPAKGKPLSRLLEDSHELLEDLIAKGTVPPREAYTKMRAAVSYMWTAHRDLRKKTKLSR